MALYNPDSNLIEIFHIFILKETLFLHDYFYILGEYSTVIIDKFFILGMSNMKDFNKLSS